MKKVITVGVMLVFMSSITFGSTLDTNYIDLIFTKFDSYDEATKKERGELLDVFMTSDKGLDILCNQILTDKKESMDKHGISEETLKRNIEVLKSWSVEDRKSLVSAGASGDKTSVVSLNDKYKKKDDATGSETTDTTQPSGGSGTALPGIPTSPGVVDDKETEPVTRSKIGEVLYSKGFISKPIEIEAELEYKVFSDTLGHWSNENVTFLAKRGLINGNSEIEFSPNENIKKSEIVAILCRIIIEDDTKIGALENDIKDVNKEEWFYDVMNNAYSIGLINKNSNEELEPNKYLTREEVVEIIVNAINILELSVKDEMKTYKGGYKDFDQVSKTRRESMAMALNIGVIQGDKDIIAPKDPITRGEIATVVRRLYTYIQEQI